MRFFLRFVVLLIALGLASAVHGQGGLAVRGKVVDRTGASVAGAEVRLVDAQSAMVSSAVSDANGDFVLPGVAKGTYQLIVPQYAGFAERRVAVTVNGPVAGLKVALAPESVSQEITVESEGAGISTDAGANRDTVTISADEIRKVPVFDQDIVGTMTAFLDGAAGSSGGVTLVVDGVEMKGAGVSASAIQEVKINNDPYSAEFTRPGRGRIEITTKPGSPQFHGEGNFIFRDAVFNAKNHFAVVKPAEARRIYEGHLSGPVGSGGHTSFIASGSRRERDTAAIVNAIGPDGAINENVLTPQRNSQYSMRVTRDFSPTHRLSIGYNYESDSAQNAGVGGITLPEGGYNNSAREDDAIFNDRWIVTPHLINQLQITLEKDEDVTTSVTNGQTPQGVGSGLCGGVTAPVARTGVSIQVRGSFVCGGAQGNLARTENTFHMNEIVTWSHGKHYLRAGVQMPQFSRRASDDRTNRLGTFTFASLAALAAGTPDVFTQQQGPGRGLYWINEFGSFVQDQIKINGKTQVSLGLRYDWQTFLPDNNNLSPRVSLAYAPGKGPNGGKTIVRVGAGLFYDRTGGDFPIIVKLHDGVALHSAQVEKPAFAIPPQLGAVPTNIARFASNVVAPYAIQYSLGVERQVLKAMTLTAGYRGQVGVKSFRSRDGNAPVLPPNPAAGVLYPRPDANLGQVQQIESTGRNMLNALDVGFRGQAGRWFAGQAQYTLSRFHNNTGGIGMFPANQYRPNDDWGRANDDRLHRFLMLGTIYPDHWASLGVGVTLLSGPPYNETTGTDDFQTGLGNARPVGVGRNTLQATGTAALDLQWNHDFRLTKAKGDNAKVLTAGVSAFNVLNQSNYTNYIGNLTSPLFGKATAALPGRQIQFAVGYRF